jgi:5'-phosphate synthase pdxT subunit
MDAAIREGFARGLRIWGTCAGAILLAKRLRGETPHLALIDIEIERNAFGSQLDSFNTVADVPKVSRAPLPLTFIRAPKIRSAGPDVEILLRMHDYIAAAESEQILVTVFHPELTPALAFHRYFLQKCGIPVPADAPEFEPGWDLTSWTRHMRITDTVQKR